MQRRATMNIIAIIGAIIGAVIGLLIGYFSVKDENKGLAAVLAILGVVIGGVLGAFFAVVVVAIAAIALMLYAISHGS